MDHRPFEDWLLNDENLTPDQDRDLRIHLRTCPECGALARANLSLRSAAALTPIPGFTLRFQGRLAAQRKQQARRALIGLILLVVVGIGAALWLLFPYLPYLSLPPARMASIWISSMVNFALITRALQVIASTFLNVVVSLIPDYFWALLLALLVAFGFVLGVSFRVVGKRMRSAV